jgi:DnaJ-class molecular chaperone
MNDTEAYWRGWQITKIRARSGRRYRDLRFGTLAACAQCAGAGDRSDAPCGVCLGTGRITLGQAS